MTNLTFKIIKILTILLSIYLLSACSSDDTDNTSNTQESINSSDFINDADGWRIEGDAQGATGVIPNFSEMNGVGNSGYIYAIDDATDGVWYFVAPSKYHGDKSNFFNGKIEFYLIQDSDMSNQFEDDDVIIEGLNGEKIVYKFESYPGRTWTKYEINLNSTAGWIDENGDIASNDKIKRVLSNITNIKIRGEFEDGEDTGGLDGFRFIEGENRQTSSSISITSDFETGVDDWRIKGDATGERGAVPNFSEINGVGNSGYIYAIDEATNGVWYFVAPSKYHGDKSNFFNGKIEFYLIQDSDMSNQFEDDDVIIEGLNGEKIVYKFESYPGRTWTKYEINLNSTAGWIDENGDIASNDKIKRVLSNITNLMIRGEFEDGEDTGGLDGFKFIKG